MENVMIRKIGLILLTVTSIALIAGCGKKGPLQLEPELLPTQVKDFELFQVGNAIKLQWTYPQKLKGKPRDKEKARFLPERVREIRVYYSEKEILGGKFRKKSKLLRKLTANDLTLAPLDSLRYSRPIRKPRKTSPFAAAEEWRHLTYYVMLPFQLPQLDKKQHFFAIQYYYHKKKSPISDVAMIHTVTPVKPVSGLTITNENKMIKLKWRRPGSDMAGNPIPGIAGYFIFKKVEPDAEAAPQTGESSKEPPGAEAVPEPVFKRLNKDAVLLEYFEDTDTGASGNYTYYVSAAMTNIIESAASAEKSVKITDIYAPEIPANLVSFKAADHMYITWQSVGDKDFSHFRLYRRTPRRQEFTLIADNITTTQFKDKNVNKGRLYIYAVTSVDQKGNESEYSNEAQERF
jgi:predicted small lipoprotein YifL